MHLEKIAGADKFKKSHMKNLTNELNKYLVVTSISGNILFILWMTYNAISDHFRATVYELISYISLILLLAVNSFLLISKK